MPRNKTDSPLAKKYGQARVVRARNLVQASLGIKPGSEKDKDKIPWAIIGKIVQDEVKGKKLVTPKDIKDAQERYKKYGPDPSMKRYFKASKEKEKKEKEKERAKKKTTDTKRRIVKKKVSRETSKKRKK